MFQRISQHNIRRRSATIVVICSMHTYTYSEVAVLTNYNQQIIRDKFENNIKTFKFLTVEKAFYLAE